MLSIQKLKVKVQEYVSQDFTDSSIIFLRFHRLYFYLSQRMEKMTKRLSQPVDAEAGAFIGFEDSSDSELSQDEVNQFIIMIISFQVNKKDFVIDF